VFVTQFTVSTGKIEWNTQVECHWSHAFSLQASRQGTNGMLECKIPSKNVAQLAPGGIMTVMRLLQSAKD
jgi:hypothetical protein